MKRHVIPLFVLAVCCTGISAAAVEKDFRYTAVNFAPADTMDPDDPGDDVVLPAEIGDLLPDADEDGFYEVRYVLQGKSGRVASTNPGQLYGVITISGSGDATGFQIDDSFGTQFAINPAKIGGGVEVTRVDADGYATILTGTEEVTAAAVDNDAGTVSLTIELEKPLAEDERLMVSCKFQTALRGSGPDWVEFVNTVTVNGESASATIEFVEP